MRKYSRILIVDDSAVMRKLVRRMLEAGGFCNIDEAANGREALVSLGRVTFSLVISDWNMGPVSGLELLVTIRRSPHLATLPFIMMTVRSTRRFASIARDNGATHYLEKPFTAEMLMARISGTDDPLAGPVIRASSDLPPRHRPIELSVETASLFW